METEVIYNLAVLALLILASIVLFCYFVVQMWKESEAGEGYKRVVNSEMRED